MFSPLARPPISECKNITEAPLLCRQIFGSVNSDPELFILFGSVAGSEAIRSSSSGASPGSEAVHFSLGPPPDLKPSVHSLWFLTGAEAVRHFLWNPQPDPEPYRSLGRVPYSGRADHPNIEPSRGFRV